MEQQTLITVLIALASVLLGAVAGGGTVVLVYGRAIKSVLNSPVIITSLEQLAASWPAPIREAVADTGRFLEEVADDKTSGAVTTTTTTTTTPADPTPQQPAG